MSKDQIIRRTVRNKAGVVTIVIPRKFASELELLTPSNVIIEKKFDTLLIKKLQLFNQEELE